MSGDNLNNRERSYRQIDEWAGKQGLWYQLRYGRHGGSLGGWLVRLTIRVAIVVALLFVAAVFLFGRYLNTATPKTKVAEAVKRALQASSVLVESCGKDGLTGVGISRIDLKGSKNSFFEECTLGGIRGNLNLGDFVIRNWAPKQISLERADLKLKVGEETDEAANSSYMRMFQASLPLEFASISIGDLNVNWGNTEESTGSIKSARADLRRVTSEAWVLTIRSSGVFNYGLWKDWKIESCIVEITKDVTQVSEFIAKKGNATLKLVGRFTQGKRPEFNGGIQVNGLNLTDIIQEKFSDYIDGKVLIKGELKGALDSEFGLGYTLEVEVDNDRREGDNVALLEGISLLKSLSYVDPENNYQRLIFRQGRFIVERPNDGADKIFIKDIDMMARTSNTVFRLRGNFSFRSIETAEANKILLGIEDFSQPGPDEEQKGGTEMLATKDPQTQANSFENLASSFAIPEGDTAAQQKVKEADFTSLMRGVENIKIDKALLDGQGKAEAREKIFQEENERRLKEILKQRWYEGELKLYLPESFVQKFVVLPPEYFERDGTGNGGAWYTFPIRGPIKSFSTLAAARLRSYARRAAENESFLNAKSGEVPENTKLFKYRSDSKTIRQLFPTFKNMPPSSSGSESIKGLRETIEREKQEEKGNREK